MKQAILVLAASMLLTNCSPSNLAEVIKAAGQDNATFCGRITTVYGTATFMRSNIYAGDVSCDTLSVRSTTNVSVPMTITPSFQFGPTPTPLPVQPTQPTVPRLQPGPPAPPPPVVPRSTLDGLLEDIARASRTQ